MSLRFIGRIPADQPRASGHGGVMAVCGLLASQQSQDAKRTVAPRVDGSGYGSEVGRFLGSVLRS